MTHLCKQEEPPQFVGYPNVEVEDHHTPNNGGHTWAGGGGGRRGRDSTCQGWTHGEVREGISCHSQMSTNRTAPPSEHFLVQRVRSMVIP